MTSDPAVQWAAAALFGIVSAWSLWRLVTAGRSIAAASHLFHLGMGLAMVAMVWPWWVRLPVLPQVAFFAVGAAWFAAAAGWSGLDALSRRVGGGPTAGGPRAGHHESAWCRATHSVMMLAMVWALAVMTRHRGHAPGQAVRGASHADSGAAGHGAAGHVDGGVVVGAAQGAAAAVPLDAPTAVSGAVLVVLLVVGGVLFLVTAVRHARAGGPAGDRTGLVRAHLDRTGIDRAGPDCAGPDRAGIDRVNLDQAGLDLLAGGLMSLGTAAMCGLMLAG